MKPDSSGRLRVATRLKDRMARGEFNSKGCTHLDEMQDVVPSGPGCKECLEMGDGWVHLRICMECGHVGCCDQSKNKHATKHYHETGHPIMASFEPDENWIWCYPDEIGFPTY